MSNLALTFLDARMPDKALPLYEETLALRKARLGDRHPDTLGTLSDLGDRHLELGSPDKALPLFQQAAAGTESRIRPPAGGANRSQPGVMPGGPEGLRRGRGLAAEVAGRGEGSRRANLRDPPPQPPPGSGRTWSDRRGSRTRNRSCEPASTSSGKRRRRPSKHSGARRPSGPLLPANTSLMRPSRCSFRATTGSEALAEQPPGKKQNDARPERALAEVVERLIQLYAAWDKPEKSADWRAKRDESKRRPASR